MRQDFIHSDAICVSLLNDDLLHLEATAEFLKCAGFKIRPFTDPATFLKNAGIHPSPAAIVNFRGSNIDGLAVANRLREVSPTTLVIITLKVHDQKARGVLLGQELIDLIKRHAASISRDFDFSERTKLREREGNLGRCA